MAIDHGQVKLNQDTGTFINKDGNVANYSDGGLPGGHNGTAKYPGSPGGLVRNVDGPCSNGVLGVVMPYYWSELEHPKGVYDFGQMDADFACCKSLGVQMIAMIVGRTFNTALNPLPGINGGATDTIRYLNQDPYGVQYSLSGGGWTLSRWNLAVVQVRLNLLVQEIANRFGSDANFEGIATQETASNMADNNGPGPSPIDPYIGSEEDRTNYNSTNFLAGLKLEAVNINAASTAWRHFGYQNFIPQAHGDPAGQGKQFCDQYAAYLPTVQSVMGGPDILPGDSGLQNSVYPRYDDIHRAGNPAGPSGPLFCSAQPHSYSQSAYTMQELLDWCTGQGPAIGGRHLYLDYFFWSWIRGSGGNNFNPDARLVIAANPMTPFWTP